MYDETSIFYILANKHNRMYKVVLDLNRPTRYHNLP